MGCVANDTWKINLEEMLSIKLSLSNYFIELIGVLIIVGQSKHYYWNPFKSWNFCCLADSARVF